RNATTPRVVAAPPCAARSGPARLAELLRKARGTGDTTCASRRAPRLRRARRPNASFRAPPDPAYRGTLYRAALRPAREHAARAAASPPREKAQTDVRRAFAASMLALLAAPCLGSDPNYAARPEVQQFVRDVAARHGLAEEALLAAFSRVERAEPILEAIKPPPPKARSWEEYRGNFVNEQRITGGRRVWEANREPLMRAEQRYGVPAEYIVAIIGVETFYGRYAGRWRVLD